MSVSGFMFPGFCSHCIWGWCIYSLAESWAVDNGNSNEHSPLEIGDIEIKLALLTWDGCTWLVAFQLTSWSSPVGRWPELSHPLQSVVQEKTVVIGCIWQTHQGALWSFYLTNGKKNSKRQKQDLFFSCLVYLCGNTITLLPESAALFH